jgi:ribonuclease G
LTDWIVERGIGETRAALVENGDIVEARIEVDGAVPAGSIVGARLTGIGTGAGNAIALDDRGIEYLLPRGAPGVTEGAAVTLEITREAIPGAETWKRPLARISDMTPHRILSPAEQLGGREMTLPSAEDPLGVAGWNELIEQARTGTIQFAGGELRICPTPAMTLIDVDGYLAPDELATVGAGEAAKAIRRLGIGGSIGVDLPTSGSKAARQSAAAAIDAHLPRPFERTAVNGFGFVQIVRPRTRASLVELAQDRAGFEARALLRRAVFEPPGPKRIVAHPALIAELEAHPTWLEALARQLGGAVSLRADAALPMSGGYAEPD